MNHRIELIQPDGARACFTAAPDESLLEAADRAGVALPRECTFGGCGTCRIHLEAGSVAYEDFPMALTPEEAEQGYALACQARACSDLVIQRASGPALADPCELAARVHSIGTLSPDVWKIVLQVDPAALPACLPGQYVNVLLPGEAGARSFSLASASGREAGLLEFHVRRIAGGHFTDGVLAATRAGDTWRIEAPLGAFCYHERDYRPLVMVATGTGLAPIRAILESMFDTGECPPVALYWGGRTEADLYLRDEIAQWAHRLDDFTFVPVLSRADAGWTGRRGYVQDAVLQDIPDLSEHAIYLCGSPLMIADAKAAFLAHGASADHLYSDSFLFQRGLAEAA
ncbi:2Fe-2S iron-sulfur cluster-binding protein [Pseudomonadota bacterium AL_CKDN230030165-1A_HGKHYDSX7]